MSISNKTVKYWVTNPDLDIKVFIVGNTNALTHAQFCDLVRKLICSSKPYDEEMKGFCADNYIDDCNNYNILVKLTKNENVSYVFNEKNIKELLDLFGFLIPTIREKYLEFLIFKKEQSSGRL